MNTRKANALRKQLESHIDDTPANQKTLDLLVQSLADYAEAVEHLDTEGRVMTTHTKALKPNPWLSVQKNAYESYLKLADALGLTPKSKGKTAQPTGTDELDDLLGG